ncbi:hypothetical protein B5E80_15305 [Flavonifractor sp. An135]|nr:NUMOD4 domain-containing protein [Flavonifractor sp. An135]OUQ22164.1 hypothetical protein B5E80_15305 [Flavonifractor sp. An135]
MGAEVWKDIPGYEGRYQASTYGRIRSVDREITQIGRWGRPFTRKLKGRVLRPAATKKDPHLYVILGHGANGSTVHSLVARTFLGPPCEGEEVRHLDGDAANNRVENLAYGSRTDNILDVFRINRSWRKLSLQDMREIKHRLDAGETGASVARSFGVSATTISRVKLGRYRSCSII